MSELKETEWEHLGLRLPAELKIMLRDEAKLNFRSMSAQVEYIMRRHFAARDRDERTVANAV